MRYVYFIHEPLMKQKGGEAETATEFLDKKFGVGSYRVLYDFSGMLVFELEENKVVLGLTWLGV